MTAALRPHCLTPGCGMARPHEGAACSECGQRSFASLREEESRAFTAYRYTAEQGLTDMARELERRWISVHEQYQAARRELRGGRLI